MEILLNGKTLDFTLENEKNLGEIIRGVESWLNNSDLVITSVKISDNELLSDNTDTWKSTPIEDINEVSLTVKSMSEVQISSMQNIIHFLSMLKTAIMKKDSKLQKELINGYPFMIESLILLIKRLKSEALRNQATVYIQRFPVLSNEIISGWTNEEMEEVFTTIDKLLIKLTELIEQMANPSQALQNLSEKLRISIQDISEVSILLQTGKDREAMNILIAFSDTFQEFLRVFLILKNNNNMDINSLRISDMSFEEYYNELNGVLKELIDAFNLHDSVLIGDLLEYEIAPRLEGLIKFIERLKTSNGNNN